MLLLFVSLFLVCSSITVGKEKFYVYDWPELVDRYANFTDRDHTSHGVEFPAWTQHRGAGRLVDKENLEHKTSQFSLHKLFYERALIDPRRTLDPGEATTFLIPFDLGMHVAFLEANGRMRRSGCPLVGTVEDALNNQPYFKRKFGHDHVLVFSINYNMNYFMNAEACQNFLRLCFNCTKLSIDEYLFTAKHRDFESQYRGVNWHAVPFPSDYHYSSHANDLLLATGIPHRYNRGIIVSFTGNPRRFNTYSTQIRESLVKQCSDMGDNQLCMHGSYKHDKKVTNNQLSRDSVFCLQPPGDMPSRKGVFDAILSGCIPVLFHPLTAKYMYEWHWGQDLWEDIAISFDSSDENRALINGTENVIQYLVSMYQDVQSANYVEGVGNGVASQKNMKGILSNADRVKHALAGGRKEVRRRQYAMAEAAHQLQYSLVEAAS
eukprot:GSChrysophyteH1.ASY1.ANO1.2275.1 assembled CDS